MKKHYTHLLFALFASLLAAKSQAQCVYGGTGQTVAYDTTIKFPTGATNRLVKFPKFNAQTGMVTCVKLIVTIVGVVDSVALQNYSGSPQTATFNYNRTDNMTGPGLTPSLSNSFNGSYGPYTLDAYDAPAGSGPDFHSVSKDTVLRQQKVRTLTDSTEILQFYGPAGDSVAYNYNINVSTSANITGGSSSGLVLTSALVNFRFEYCTCPLSTLPVGLKNFSVARQGATTAALRWEAEAGTDHYFYVVETSTDGRRFDKASVLNKQTDAAAAYQYGHALARSQSGKLYFRIRQQWLDGYYRYSETRWLEFANQLGTSVSLFPNPSSGNVGIKFVAAHAGRYKIEVSNAGGQVVSRKEIMAAETDLKRLDALQKGVYYVRITEVGTGNSVVQQLVVN